MRKMLKTMKGKDFLSFFTKLYQEGKDDLSLYMSLHAYKSLLVTLHKSRSSYIVACNKNEDQLNVLYIDSWCFFEKEFESVQAEITRVQEGKQIKYEYRFDITLKSHLILKVYLFGSSVKELPMI